MTVREIRLNKDLSYRTFPYRCEPDSLEFRIDQFAVDDGSFTEPEQPHYLDLDEYRGWDTLHLRLEIRIPDGLLGKVFPEFDDIPGMLVVAAHCRTTYLREGIVVEDEPIRSGTYTRDVELSSDSVAGSLDLRPLLVRTTDTDVGDEYATEAGVFVADGPRGRVDFEDDDAGDESLLEVRPRTFSEEDDDSRFPPEDRLHYLDLESDPGRPIVWVNDDHTQVASLMAGDGGSQYDRLTRDLVWNQVMSPVWTRLVTVAAIEYDADTDEWDPEWQAAVFEDLHNELYDDLTPEKAAERLQEDLTKAPVDATRRVEDAVQSVLDPATCYTKHIQGLTD